MFKNKNHARAFIGSTKLICLLGTREKSQPYTFC